VAPLVGGADMDLTFVSVGVVCRHCAKVVQVT
jgi:hypothetical protein